MICAHVALKLSGTVVWPPTLMVNVPPVAVPDKLAPGRESTVEFGTSTKTGVLAESPMYERVLIPLVEVKSIPLSPP